MTKIDKNTYESALINRHGRNIHEKLSAATVAICGLGGLGSNLAISLARINVGRLILIDFDLVDPTNLNRQQYNIEQVGIPKPDAMKQNLEKINPFIEYITCQIKITSKNAAKLIEPADIVAECFDLPDQKQMLVETALLNTTKKIIVSASGMAGFGNSNAIKTRKINKRLYLVGDCETAASDNNSLMAPRVALTAAHQANAITELIINGEIKTEE